MQTKPDLRSLGGYNVGRDRPFMLPEFLNWRRTWRHFSETEEQEAGRRVSRVWPESRREVMRTVVALPAGTKRAELGDISSSQSLLSGVSASIKNHFKT